MDQTSAEPFVLDWDFDDIEDEACFSCSVDETISDTKPGMPNVTDLYRTTTAPLSSLMEPETLDLFRILSDSDTSSTSDDDENQIVAFDSDNENISERLATDDARGRIIASLEHLILSSLEQFGTNTIELEVVNCTKTKEDGSPAHRVLNWPKKAKSGSFKSFARLFRVVDLVHEALLTNIPTTKRDIFYKDVPLFKTQSVVDDLVDDLAATLEVSRGDLNVRASPKGLFFGTGLSIHLKQGGIVHGTNSEGALIPASVDISHLQVSETVSWVLIVEKEAVFQTLCRASLTSLSCCPGTGLVITGKGYPDLATRELVGYLSNILPTSVPILALVDADAYGLDILSVYKFGSQKLSYEGAKTTAPRIIWLGIWSSELSSLSIDKDELLPLTNHDHKKALQMLKRNDKMMPKQWRTEISHMLHSRRKAEIEIISSALKVALQTDEPKHSFLQPHFEEGDVIANYPLVQYLIPKLNFWVKAV